MRTKGTTKGLELRNQKRRVFILKRNARRNCRRTEGGKGTLTSPVMIERIMN